MLNRGIGYWTPNSCWTEGCLYSHMKEPLWESQPSLYRSTLRDDPRKLAGRQRASSSEALTAHAAVVAGCVPILVTPNPRQHPWSGLPGRDGGPHRGLWRVPSSSFQIWTFVSHSAASPKKWP